MASLFKDSSAPLSIPTDRVHLGHLVVEVRSERVGHEVNTVERADVDAELARRAELAVHDRLRDVLRLDLHHEVAVLVLNARDGAVNRAHGAVDTPVLVDHELLVLAARDRVRRALDLADTAPDTRVVNEMRHGPPFMKS